MSRKWSTGVSVVVTLVLMGLTPVAFATPEGKLAEQLTRLMQVGRKIVSDNQALINDAAKGDKGFTPQAFADQVLADYAKATGIDLHKVGDEGKLLLTLLEAQKETVAEAQPVINRAGMGFKGFIPAAFVRKAGERFTLKTDIRMKFTAMEYRNARNTPDEFEKKVFQVFAGPGYPKGKPYEEVVQVDGQRVYRIMFPEYAAKSCLACHGEPRGEKDITGGRKEGQKEGDLAGALSFTIPVK